MGDFESDFDAAITILAANSLGGCDGFAFEVFCHFAIYKESHFKRLLVWIKPYIDGVFDDFFDLFRDCKGFIKDLDI